MDSGAVGQAFFPYGEIRDIDETACIDGESDRIMFAWCDQSGLVLSPWFDICR